MERAIAVATESDGAAVRASTAERAEPGPAPSSLGGVNGWIALAGAVLLHGAILAALLIQFDWGQRAAPPAQEIPVEIVVEQPKPPEPKPQPSSAPPPQLDLKPAHDAPRAVSEEKTPLAADATTNGEKAPTPDAPQAGATPPPNEAAKADASSPSPPAAAKDDGGDQPASDATPSFDAPAAASADAPDFAAQGCLDDRPALPDLVDRQAVLDLRRGARCAVRRRRREPGRRRSGAHHVSDHRLWPGDEAPAPHRHDQGRPKGSKARSTSASMATAT